ncbi:MAG: hypothetical protein IPM57_08605 [Oligoflexia bacterium]|nr:hypothetical protein [Oligoflexia bacterium]
MDKSALFLLKIILLTFNTSLASERLSETPFWKSKPAVYKKIKEDRAIVVSAKTIHKENIKNVILNGAGWVKAPLDFVYENAIDFNQYSKILPYVEETTYDKSLEELTAKGSFLTINANVKMKLKVVKEGRSAQIKWSIIKGIFDGMEGVVLMEKTTNHQGDDVTECSLKANYEGDANIPDFLLHWGLEFIGQRMAYKMRNHMESLWQKQNY